MLSVISASVDIKHGFKMLDILNNSLFYFTFLIGLTFYLIYRYLTLNYDYWKNVGIPYKEPDLFFGNIKDLMLLKCNIGELYIRLYNMFYNEKVVGVYRFRQLELMVNDPELIKCILVKDFQHFYNRDKNQDASQEPLLAHLFVAKSNYWNTTRHKLTPLFSSGKLKNMFPLIVEKGVAFQDFIKDTIKENEVQEVTNLMANYTTDVIGSCAFGLELNSMADKEATFRKMGRKIFEPSGSTRFKHFLRELSPAIFYMFGGRVTNKPVEDFFVSMVADTLEQREKSGNKRNDFMDLMLDFKKQGKLTNEKKFATANDNDLEDIEITNEFIAAQAFIFFAAGFETSSGLISFTLNELALHPEIQEKLYNEISGVVKKYDGKLTYDGVMEMHYLEMVLSETMRKYPALGTIQRVCTKPYTLPGTNVTIQKGTTIAIPLRAIHYDPKYYPDPLKYDPERFSPEVKKERHPMTYMPFGEGPRNCIGLRFGKIQSSVGLISLLQKFKVEPCDKTETQVTLHKNTFVIASQNGIWVKIKPRF